MDDYESLIEHNFSILLMYKIFNQSAKVHDNWYQTLLLVICLMVYWLVAYIHYVLQRKHHN